MLIYFYTYLFVSHLYPTKLLEKFTKGYLPKDPHFPQKVLWLLRILLILTTEYLHDNFQINFTNVLFNFN